MICRYVRSVARLSSVFTITYQYTPGELPATERETVVLNYRLLTPLLGAIEKCQDREPWHFSMEGQERLELSTPCLRGRCSNQLSYWPVMLCKKYVLNMQREPSSSLVRAPGAYTLLGDKRLRQAAELLARDSKNYTKSPLFWQVDWV